MSFVSPRGTKDILPEEVAYWQHVENVAQDVFQAFNYQEIRTPIFESTELFERSIGDQTDIVQKEMYSFQDKGNRALTLRPEGTAPVARSVIQHQLLGQSNPLKLYYQGPFFRYERPQAGRYRQFHQIGVEYIGTQTHFADAEVISLAYHLFQQLGIQNLTVTLNSIGDELSRPVINEAIRQFIQSSPVIFKQLCDKCQYRLDRNPLRILDCKNKKCQSLLVGLPDIKTFQSQECRDHFNAVVEELDRLDIPFEVNPYLVRGLDYYSKTTFEIVSSKLGAQNAICGGGRYDGLIQQLSGKATPAFGFAFGVERVVTLLRQYQNLSRSASYIRIYVIPVGASFQSTCFELLYQLRKAGFDTDMDVEKCDLKSLLKKANKHQASHVIIYGEEEAEQHQVTIKTMADRSQSSIKIDQAVHYFLNLKKELQRSQASYV